MTILQTYFIIHRQYPSVSAVWLHEFDLWRITLRQSIEPSAERREAIAAYTDSHTEAIILARLAQQHFDRVQKTGQTPAVETCDTRSTGQPAEQTS